MNSVTYCYDFNVVTGTTQDFFGDVINRDILRHGSDNNSDSCLVGILHIRRTPTSGLIGKSPQVPIWAGLLEISGVRSVFGLEASCDQTDIQEILEAISRSDPKSFSAFFIAFENSDLEAPALAQHCANWVHRLGCSFVIGASNSVGHGFLDAEKTHFDFFYVSHSDECLLHAPRLILEQHSSFISYDFEDLISVWTGRTGQIWSVQARISSLKLLVDERLRKYKGPNSADFILRYEGSAGLDAVDAMVKFLEGALQPHQCLVSAWQTRDAQKDGRLELCLLDVT